jgi:phosphoglycerate dehydrogenase-like enzyme
MSAMRSLLNLAVCSLAVGLVIAPATAQQGRTCPSCEEGAALVKRFGLREDVTPVRERAGWAPPKRIVTFGGEEWAARLRAVAPNAVVVGVNDNNPSAEILAGADVWVGLCTPDIVKNGPSLKLLQLISAGADACAALPAVTQRNILITNAQAIYGPQIADHVMALLLSLTRKVPHFAVQQNAGKWSINTADPNAIIALRMTELEGKNLLVIGLGGIGTEVARRAYGFGMHVRATRNSGRDKPDFVEYVGLAPEALELAKWADVVVNTTPLTPDTRNMFNARFFAAMKPTAYFLNAGRGESVVTADLTEALQSGRIAGAGLDVTNPEPLPAGHPLWSMPNVVITPHIAAGSDEAMVRLVTLVVENVRRYAAGEKMVSVVDVKRGY